MLSDTLRRDFYKYILSIFNSLFNLIHLFIMKKIILSIACLFCLNLVKAQEVQWAFRVLEYSSQKESRAFSANQVLGKPNVLPASGENMNAWQPKDNRKEEYIKVGFLNPMKPKQIVIAESFHPGGVFKILVYDADGKEFNLNLLKSKRTGELSKVFTVNCSEIDFTVFAVKLFLKSTKAEPVAIDAIGITSSDKPVKIKLNQAEYIKSNMVATILPQTVNSIYQEFGPLLSPDGKTLFFGRREDPNNIGGVKDSEDIWYSNWDESTGKWLEAKNMGIPLNNEHPNFINSISPDGNTILLGNSYLPNGKMSGGASMSYKTTTGWSFPRKLEIEDEENKSDKANFFLSNSQKVLMMSVERKKETEGDRDLYVSFLKEDSSWTKPLNLGKKINTIGTEAAPFLASDDRTLYFTSTGLAGYGGSDIYVSRRLDESWTKWSEPENLGPIVNTAFDESYFTISAYADKVYYTSKSEKEGDFDMYTLDLPKILKPLPVMFVKGRVLDSKTNKPLPLVRIKFENLVSGVEVGIATSSPETGEYSIVLPLGYNYGYLAEKQGYISVNANLDLIGTAEYADVRKNLYLTPLEAGQIVVLNNVFFDFDKYVIRKESYLELDRIAKVLAKNPSLKIEISGFTDNVGSIAYNDLLSYNRADAVVSYLIIKSGTKEDRVTLKHYGEDKPVADNSTEAGRQLNRRVEFKIIAK